MFWLCSRTAWSEGYKVNFKTYDVAAWLTIVIHILPDISRSKDNQTMIFSLEKSCSKCGGETSPRPFSEKLKLIISLKQ